VFADGERWRDLDAFRGQPILRMRAASMVLTSGGYVFSHDSSAIIHRLGAPDPRTSLVHVTRRKVHGDRERTGTKHHLAPYGEDQVGVIEGLPVLDRARTALDMVREHGRAHGLAACDAAMRNGTRRADLLAALERMQNWPHSRCMRWCVEHADPRAESYLESLGRDFVLELGIGPPDCQTGFHDGHRTAYVDILVRRHYFEIDGGLKYDDINPSGLDPRIVLMREKARSDFLAGFKLGSSRLTHFDLHAGRAAARARVLREYADTCARFGTSIDDLAPYIVTRPL
jgi:hypothetical protein